MIKPAPALRRAVQEETKEGVSYEMLQDLLRSERRSNRLMAVTTRFWPELRAFLEKVTQEFRVEQAKDPFSRKVMELTDEVKNAKQAAEALWALRERKLAMLALASRDRKVPDGITPDEGHLFQRLLESLDEARGRVFEGTVAAPGPVPVPPAPRRRHAPPVSLPPIGETIPALQMPIAEPVAAVVVNVPSDTRRPGLEMVTIRALGDIPPFVGPDMQTYLLKAGDVATVPPSIANLLVKRNKAAVIEVA